VKLLRVPKKFTAVAILGTGFAIAGALTWVSSTVTMHYTYRGPNGVGTPMYETSYPIVPNLQPWATGEQNVALKYLRSHFDPYYWSFSAGAPLVGQAGSVFRIFPFGDGPQGVADTFGFTFPAIDPPFSGTYSKNTIFLERMFMNGTRWLITTSNGGNGPFNGLGGPYQGWQHGAGMSPDLLALYGYAPHGQTYTGDLFVVEHYQWGPYHSVILHDVYGQQTDFNYGGYPNGGWPNDPDNGFNGYHPPAGHSGPPPPENDAVQTGDTITAADCSSGSWYPEGQPAPGQSAPILPCVVDGTANTTDTSSGLGSQGAGGG